MTNLTDRRAILIALHTAIESEDALIDAYGNNPDEEAVQRARANIAAFRRVLKRYYPETHRKTPLDKMIDDGLKNGTVKYVNIYDLLKQKIEDIE